jgi:hypothetical protein
MNPVNYILTLHHLSPDAKEASSRSADLELPRVNPEKLRALLEALAGVATRHRTDLSVSPEIRIKHGRDEVLVRAKDGGLNIVSWDKKLTGTNLAVDEILARLAALTSPEAAAAAPVRSAPVVAAPAGQGLSGRAKLILLVAAFVALNGFTAWMLMKPPETLLPDYDLLPSTDSRELLVKAAGEYETGSKEGDRRLIIQPDGSMILSTYGPRRQIIEQLNLSAQGALTAGRPVLLTSDPDLMEIKDADTVVLYGNIYKRRSS